ncbi:MAG: Sulfur carrier protein adenylyltransferase ThiF [uncultured Thiotrichaceae bacterium]|uniref:Molybdopterin-synthase adenylyltransferase n=1 Tax=uncultured Thiotrichaceae bacterium TaxID=298394 RepID=A0A6S6U871_9GAMM|nr:MAG: Sulfur carrier protein adenylyltransferase ThiF [uncultured Thiotrichaceae bacterium]
MNDQQLLRYSRQILLPEVGIDGQQEILASRVLVIGMGGLGSPITLYLAASGVGHLTLLDFDEVELSNLQRQIIHNEHSIGTAKTLSAQVQAAKINSEIQINTINQKLDPKALSDIISDHDIIVDGSDNFETRFMVNQLCHDTQKPLVSGAVIRMEGQISTYDFREQNAPCYRCLYAEEGETEDTCSTTGVLSPVAGIVGSIQATEVLKIITGLPTLHGKLLLLDAKYMQFRTMNLKKDPACPVCN